MGGGPSKANPPPSNAIPSGKTRICVAGFTTSHHTGHTRAIVGIIAAKYKDEYESWFYFDGMNAFYEFLKRFDNVPFPPHLKGHCTSPFVWFERGADFAVEPVGGREHFCQWVLKTFPKDDELVKLASTGPSLTEIFHNGAKAPQSTADVSVHATAPAPPPA